MKRVVGRLRQSLHARQQSSFRESLNIVEVSQIIYLWTHLYRCTGHQVAIHEYTCWLEVCSETSIAILGVVSLCNSNGVDAPGGRFWVSESCTIFT